jgi:hypothetical protein
VSAPRLTFSQRRPPFADRAEAEVGIGDLTLEIHRFSDEPVEAKISGYKTGRKSEFVSIKVSAFTDTMATWRRLDKMRVFHKIERAQLRESDDLARLLVGCGLRHVPYAGYQYALDGGEGEKRRIKELHS